MGDPVRAVLLWNVVSSGISHGLSARSGWHSHSTAGAFGALVAASGAAAEGPGETSANVAATVARAATRETGRLGMGSFRAGGADL